MRKCWNCRQPTDDDNSRVCSDEICQRAEKKSSNGEFRNKGLVKQHEKNREYNQRPEVKAKQREYQRKYNQRPEKKARQREYQREYRQRPEYKAKAREYEREYRQRPEVKERKRERYQRNKILREEE